MTYLTPEEEKQLDNNMIITVERGDHTFRISPMDIIAYGAIDFNDGSQDMERIEYFRLLDSLAGLGKCIPARYNYKNHTCLSPNRTAQYYDTCRPEKYLQYVHGFLGHPEITVIFKIKK